MRCVRGLASRLPVGLLIKLGLATLFHPRTRGWGAASAAIAEYVDERKAADRRALGLDRARERSDERQVPKSRLLSRAARWKGPATPITVPPRNLARRSASSSPSSRTGTAAARWRSRTSTPKLQTYLSARNLSIAEKMGFDTVMAPCNGCYHNLKKAEYDLANDAELARGQRPTVAQSRARDL